VILDHGPDCRAAFVWSRRHVMRAVDDLARAELIELSAEDGIIYARPATLSQS
jgi:hypothetical protein